jgi:hypothetical protein
MTVNEVRELENLNPIGPEGDVHYIPQSMTTLGQIGEPPQDTPGEPADGTPEDEAEDTTTAQEDSTNGT